MEFPLKPDFFPKVQLAGSDKQAYVELAQRSVAQLRRLLVENAWKRVSERQGMIVRKASCIDGQQHRNGGFPTAQACLVVCATVFASGTISEVLEAIASPVSEEYRKAMKFLHEDAFLDGVCLHAFMPPRATSRNAETSNIRIPTTIKWAAFDEAAARTRKDNASRLLGTDYCFVEHSGIQRDEMSGTSFGYCVQESIARDAEVPVMTGLGLRRGQFHHAGILIVPTEHNNVLQVSSILQMNTALAASSVVLEKLMTRHVSAIRRLAPYLDRRRLSRMKFISRDEWVPDVDRRSCAVCCKMFALRRKHHCRNCGEVVCSMCAPPREVDVTSFGVAQLRICTACVVRARAANADSTDLDRAIEVASEDEDDDEGDDAYEFQSISSRSSETPSTKLQQQNPHLQAALAESTMDGESFSMSMSSPRMSADSNFSVSLDSPDELSSSAAFTLSPQTAIDAASARSMRQSMPSSASSGVSVSDLNTTLQDHDMRITSVPSCPPAHAASTGAILYTGGDHTTSSIAKPPHSAPSKFGADRYRGRSSCAYSESFGSYETRESSKRSSSSSSSTSLRDVLSALHDMKTDLAAVSSGHTPAHYITQHYKHTLPPPHFQRSSEQTSWPVRTRSTTTTLSISSATSKPSEVRDSSSTMDIDLIESGCITLISPELTRRLRGQESAERPSRSRISSASACTALSDDDTNPSPIARPSATGTAPVAPSRNSTATATAAAPADAVGATDASILPAAARGSELTTLRGQVESLRRTLEDTTSQLNYYQARAMVKQHVDTLEKDVRDLEIVERRRRRVSTVVDPVVVQRKQMYHALLSELHEIMGLPAVKARESTIETFKKELYGTTCA